MLQHAGMSSMLKYVVQDERYVHAYSHITPTVESTNGNWVSVV